MALAVESNGVLGSLVNSRPVSHVRCECALTGPPKPKRDMESSRKETAVRGDSERVSCQPSAKHGKGTLVREEKNRPLLTS